MKKIIPFLILLAACTPKTDPDQLSSIQLLDRNGFSETISTKDRLETFDKTDYLRPQPYQKIVRVFGKSSLGKTSSKVTTYHSNGHPHQYLEIENGRAHGKYQEWHPNGKLKIDARVIEGTPDISDIAQLSWFFDGPCSVFDEKGNTLAQISYEKGLLQGVSTYYDSTHRVVKVVPYQKDKIDGKAVSYWSADQIQSSEVYQNGILLQGSYLDKNGTLISQIENGEGKQALFEEGLSLIEYHEGEMEGKVENFDEKGQLISTYQIHDGMKNGEEWEYYSSNKPKLCLTWENDTLEGLAKTWYENGALESERQMKNNKKHGPAFAYYPDGELMLVEEYEEDILVKGSYFKKWQKKPISEIENGKGVATLFDKEGKLLKKIPYLKGQPQAE